MRKSVYNHVLPLKKNKSLLVNTLSGAMDIVPGYYCEYLEAPLAQEENDITAFLKQRCYLLDDNANERELTRSLYRQLQSVQRKRSPLKCVLIVTFDCNLRCSYCWQQHQIDREKSEVLTRDKVDKVLEAIAKLAGIIPEKSENPPIVQVFGGEPLLEENAEIIEYILQRCQERHYDVQITTNGANLSKFQEMILHYGVKEIQVTVDGSEELHNKRRLGSDYKSIMAALDKLISCDALYVKLRVNIDQSNLHGLLGLANEIIDRRWYTSRKFYAYLAPLRDCSFAQSSLISKRRKLLAALNKLKESFPQIEVFDVLGWNGYQPVRALDRSGRFPFPKAHICDVNLNQFVFSPSGQINLCAEEAHGTKDVVGAFYPAFEFAEEKFKEIYCKSPLDLDRCTSCALLPVCGGGCNLLTEKETFLSHYCKSVRECFEFGLEEYLQSRGEAR